MHPLAQSLHRIAFEDRYGLLQQDRAGVELGGDDVECRAAARRPVRRHRDHVESAVDQIAQVGALTGDANSDFQRIDTRSGPAWRTTSPTTAAPSGTSSGAVTTIIPSPMLNVPYISSSATRPRLLISSKMGGTCHARRSRRALKPSGRHRGKLPRTPPPVMCAAAFHCMRPRSCR